MHPTAVLNVVGLTPALMGEDTPHLNALVRGGAHATIDPHYNLVIELSV